MKPTVALLSCAIAVWAAPAAAQQDVGPRYVGTVKVVDGDSLEMAGTRIRLYGIDAPEGRQTCMRETAMWSCGEDAASALRELVGNFSPECAEQDRDVYGRIVAVCSVRGVDLAHAMVLYGFAVALPGGTPAYDDAQAKARVHRLGIWNSTFDTPAQWRAAHPRENSQGQAGSGMTAARQTRAHVAPAVYRVGGMCAIKGNLSYRNGEAIYYLPGMKYYSETRPEARFCTEAEANSAGFRRSRGG